MAVRVSRSLRERARQRGGVAVLAMLDAGLTRARQRSCARSLDGKAKEKRLYHELDLITARLKEPALLELANRPEVREIHRAPDEDPVPVIERDEVSQEYLDELADEFVAMLELHVRAERVREGATESTAEAGPRSDEPGSRAWGLNDIRVPELWDQEIWGDDVIVAHLDTGVHEDHVAFTGRVAHRAVTTRNGDLRVTGKMVDRFGHGTHTAGTICGGPVNSVRVGVAPRARLASATVMEGGDLTARILRALQWVLKLCDDGENVRVLNLSFGFKGVQPAFRELLCKIEQAGILTVACVGNDGARSSRAPGNYEETLSVGAYDRNYAVWYYSSSNEWESGRRFVPDLVAPGVEIASADAAGTTGLRVDRGSSMATACVSGLAALLFSEHPGASAAAVKQAILDGCSLFDGIKDSRQGYGCPDAVGALEALDEAMG